CMQALQIPDSF
nr:immunoglobulin light chain junction region [Macaca mulatta]MOW12244.1 immunoglobulin light chain junction region [Macaca mulatta]MOW13444.1 immunoglobulin light chain junction region [Macaca mulatta]